jgi:hypothetical protein
LNYPDLKKEKEINPFKKDINPSSSEKKNNKEERNFYIIEKSPNNRENITRHFSQPSVSHLETEKSNNLMLEKRTTSDNSNRGSEKELSHVQLSNLESGGSKTPSLKKQDDIKEIKNVLAKHK